MKLSPRTKMSETFIVSLTIEWKKSLVLCDIIVYVYSSYSTKYKMTTTKPNIMKNTSI